MVQDMKALFARSACAAAALAASWLPLGTAASVVPPGSERILAFLESAVGRYPREIGLWEHAVLHQRLSALIGRRLPFFHGNMWNTTTVSRQGNLIYVLGSRRPLAGQDSAVLVADLARDTLWVWVKISGQVFEYRERPAPRDLPAEVEIFIDSWRADTRETAAPAASYR